MHYSYSIVNITNVRNKNNNINKKEKYDCKRIIYDVSYNDCQHCCCYCPFIVVIVVVAEWQYHGTQKHVKLRQSGQDNVVE